MVEGACDSPFHFRRKKIDESRAPPTILLAQDGPPSPLAWGGMLMRRENGSAYPPPRKPVRRIRLVGRAFGRISIPLLRLAFFRSSADAKTGATVSAFPRRQKSSGQLLKKC